MMKERRESIEDVYSFFSNFPDLSSTPSSVMTSENYKSGQWRAPVSTHLCAFCNKTVYPAEEVMGAGQRFHKLCLKCTSCNTLLTSGSLNEREKKIYCETCYRRKFGPRGVSRSLATSYLETPPNSPHSEADSSSGLTNIYDSTFDPKPSVSLPEEDFRRSTSMTFPTGVTARQAMSIGNRPTSASVVNGTAFKAMSISGNVCPRCSKTVYSAEEVKAAGKSFHKRCYTCANCKGSISGGRYSEHNGELYDNNCYQRLFGPRGVGFGIGAGTLSTGN